MRLAEPVDQATGLRRLFAAEAGFHALGVLSADAGCGARAGAALALGLGRRGHRVLVLDETRPPHNVGGALGVVARHALADARARGLLGVVSPAGDGIALLAAPDGAALLASLTERALLDLIEDWRAREDTPEWLVLNAGDAPRGGGALALTAGMRVLALPGDRARLADAYAVMKAAQTTWAGQCWLVMVEDADAERARALFTSLRDTARRFLGVEAEYLGLLPPRRAGEPPSLPDAALVEALADDVAARPQADRVDFAQYWQRLWLFSRMRLEAAEKRGSDGRWHATRR